MIQPVYTVNMTDLEIRAYIEMLGDMIEISRGELKDDLETEDEIAVRESIVRYETMLENAQTVLGGEPYINFNQE